MAELEDMATDLRGETEGRDRDSGEHQPLPSREMKSIHYLMVTVAGVVKSSGGTRSSEAAATDISDWAESAVSVTACAVTS